MKLKEIIQDRYGVSGDEFTRQDVDALLHETKQTYTDGYIALALQKMRAGGVLESASRGRYKFPLKTPNLYTTTPDDTLKTLYAGLKQKFPMVDFCLWDVRDLLPLVQHIPSVRMKIVNCAKDVVDSVTHTLINMTDTIVLPSPDRYVLDNFTVGREFIAVLPLVSQAPTVTVDGIPAPRLEKVLVDILCEEPFYFLKGNETYNIYSEALKSYALNLRTLRRYAGRRNRMKEVDDILKEIQ